MWVPPAVLGIAHSRWSNVIKLYQLTLRLIRFVALAQGWFPEAEFMGCLRDATGRANLGLLVFSRECGLAGIGFATERTDREVRGR